MNSIQRDAMTLKARFDALSDEIADARRADIVDGVFVANPREGAYRDGAGATFELAGATYEIGISRTGTCHVAVVEDGALLCWNQYPAYVNLEYATDLIAQPPSRRKPNWQERYDMHCAVVLGAMRSMRG